MTPDSAISFAFFDEVISFPASSVSSVFGLKPWKYFSLKSLWAGICDASSLWSSSGSKVGGSYCFEVVFLIVTN